ncbi:MAG TPA: hypothetical protein PLU71_04295 [Candidatus Dependentiae bacterium]|nr:hypothetical protein [Candidatus Dependentiae bacterium]HRQ63053.1 hypothetical protein [Candidatus Dependentiae bacterium]
MKNLCALLLLSNMVTVHQVCAMSSPRETTQDEYFEGTVRIGTKEVDLRHGYINKLKKSSVQTVYTRNGNISPEQLEAFFKTTLYFYGFTDKSYKLDQLTLDQLTQALNKRLQKRNVFIRLSDDKYYAFKIILAHYLGGQLPYVKSILEDIIHTTKKMLDAKRVQARFNPMTEEEYMKSYEKKREELMVNQSNEITIHLAHKNSYHFDSPPSSYAVNGSRLHPLD